MQEAGAVSNCVMGQMIVPDTRAVARDRAPLCCMKSSVHILYKFCITISVSYFLYRLWQSYVYYFSYTEKHIMSMFSTSL